MAILTPRSGRLTNRQFAGGALCVWFLLGLMAGSAAGADLRHRSAGAVQPGLAFAVADFDGDSRPDFANVRTGPSEFAHTEYWIQLQLSAAGRQSIRVVAPAGGLRLAARDVNGDQALDLIVTTAWLNQPVAVYLNDGHGRFTYAQPAAFPSAFHTGKTDWSPLVFDTGDAVGAPAPSPGGICSELRWVPYLHADADFVVFPDSPFLVAPLLFSYSGRAPPAGSPCA